MKRTVFVKYNNKIGCLASNELKEGKAQVIFGKFGKQPRKGETQIIKSNDTTGDIHLIHPDFLEHLKTVEHGT
jgi:hypothetical protein